MTIQADFCQFEGTVQRLKVNSEPHVQRHPSLTPKDTHDLDNAESVGDHLQQILYHPKILL